MSRDGSALTPQRVHGLEVGLAIVLGIAYVALSVAFIELAVIYLPQLLMLGALAGILATADRRSIQATSRGLVAATAAVVIGVLGLVLFRLAAVQLVGIEFVLLLPYAIGAGVVAGAWSARPETRLPRLVLHAFVGATTPVVLYAALGLLTTSVAA